MFSVSALHLSVLFIHDSSGHIESGSGSVHSYIFGGVIFVTFIFSLFSRRSIQLSGDYLEVVVRDVVVVCLHLTERLFVVLHEIVDVQILPLLYLVDVHLLHTPEQIRNTGAQYRTEFLTGLSVTSLGSQRVYMVLFTCVGYETQRLIAS